MQMTVRSGVRRRALGNGRHSRLPASLPTVESVSMYQLLCDHAPPADKLTRLSEGGSRSVWDDKLMTLSVVASDVVVIRNALRVSNRIEELVKENPPCGEKNQALCMVQVIDG